MKFTLSLLNKCGGISVNIIYVATDVYYPYMNGGSRRAQGTADIFNQNGHKAHIFSDRQQNEKKDVVINGISVHRSLIMDIGNNLRKLVSNSTITKLKNVKKKETDDKAGNYASYLEKEINWGIRDKLAHFYRHKFPIHKFINNFFSFFRLMKIVKQEKIDIIFERGPSYGVGAICAKILNRFYIVDFIDVMYSNIQLKFADLILSYFTTYQIPSNIDRDKIAKVYTATNAELFKPNGKKSLDIFNSKIRDQDFICIYTGGMYPWHGLRNIVDAAKILRLKSVHNVKFVLVGDGPVREETEKLVKENSLTNQVLFIGKIDFSLVPKYLASSHIALSLNTGDSIGFKLIEYLSAGLPVITTNADNVELILKDKKDALFVNIDDPSDLVEKIMFLIKNPAICSDMKKNAREKVIKKFTWQIHYENIIKNMVKVMATSKLDQKSFR